MCVILCVMVFSSFRTCRSSKSASFRNVFYILKSPMAVAGAHLLDCVLVEEVQADMLGALHVIVQRVPADGIDRREILSNARSLQPMLSSISCRTDT